MVVVSLRSGDVKTESCVRSFGLEFFCEPLYKTHLTPCTIPACELLLVTSPKSLDAIINIDYARSLPLVVVGSAAERAALGLGFKNMVAVFSDVGLLIDWLAVGGYRNVVYVRGNFISRDIKSELRHISLCECFGYIVQYIDLFSDGFLEILDRVSHILFFSRNAASVFSRLAAGLGPIQAAAISISNGVDDALGVQFSSRVVASAKSHAAVMERLRNDVGGLG